MMGGAVDEQVPSIGVFFAQTGIDDWNRPPCDSSQDCCYPGGNYSYLCLPQAQVWPGMVAADSSKLYVFFNETVVSQSQATWGTSWVREPGSAWGSYGRRVWVRGSVAYPTAGCWFTTDFSPADMWLQTQGFARSVVSSSSGFATAFAPGGPWTQLTAPWDPRASAAVVASGDGQIIYVGGGMDFQGGVATGVTFGDVWTVDSSVCLLTADNTFCNGHGVADPDAVVCNCDAAWSGDAMCKSCGATFAGSNCDLCKPGYWGSSCAKCSELFCTRLFSPTRARPGNNAPAPLSHPSILKGACVYGSCDGDGTQGGTGKCICNTGWVGPSCSQPLPTFAPDPPNNNNNNNNGGTLSPGAAAGVSLLVIGAAVAAGLWVFVAKFGGGPTVSAAVNSAKATGANLIVRISFPRAAGGGGGSPRQFAGPSAERAGLLSSPRAPLSPEAAAKRFGGQAYGAI